MAAQRLLQISGLSGIVAGVVLISATIMNLVIPDPGLTPINLLLTNLSTHAARDALVLNSVIFAVGGVALIGFFLGLFHALRKFEYGYALFGGVFGTLASSLAVVIFAVQAGIFPSLGALFATATEPQQALLLSLGKMAQAMIEGGFAVFRIFMGVALLSIGVCMNRSFIAREYGWGAIVMAIVLMLSVVPGLVYLYLIFFAIFGWFSLVGLKLLNLSHTIQLYELKYPTPLLKSYAGPLHAQTDAELNPAHR